VLLFVVTVFSPVCCLRVTVSRCCFLRFRCLCVTVSCYCSFPFFVVCVLLFLVFFSFFCCLWLLFFSLLCCLCVTVSCYCFLPFFVVCVLLCFFVIVFLHLLLLQKGSKPLFFLDLNTPGWPDDLVKYFVPSNCSFISERLFSPYTETLLNTRNKLKQFDDSTNSTFNTQHHSTLLTKSTHATRSKQQKREKNSNKKQ